MSDTDCREAGRDPNKPNCRTAEKPAGLRYTCQDECNDGRDNDFDGTIDEADQGCQVGTKEALAGVPGRWPQCSDGFDNDGDGNIDFPADPGCANANDIDEFNPPPNPPNP